ncbi:MAG: hypothetical protein QF817_01745 [Candidatus Poseidoniaceae archaeon]|jgi:carbamate kinase|nr:hypothetical protein [Candidatus Poseidoniaceae archaeon]
MMMNMLMAIGGEAGPAASRIAVYAIGGNALSDPSRAKKGDDSNQEQALVLGKVLADIVDLLEAGYRVVVTHGNGPQVGDLLMLEERATASEDMAHRPRTGLDSWVAATQGIIGHEIALNLDSMLQRRGRPERTAVVLTRVEVAADDPAFDLPAKPVGPVLSDEAVKKEEWDIAATVIGPRRVVASPLPKMILDSAVIHTLVGQGAVVFCGGGGGIPVIRLDGQLVGIPAVIDKDRFSALLATELSADALLISTAIDSLKTGFCTSSEKSLTEISCADALAGIESGEFPSGSMGPKLSAMVMAKQNIADCEVLLCQPGDALKALRGKSGTRLV